MRRLFILGSSCLLLLHAVLLKTFAGEPEAAPISVASASNVADAIQEIASAFTRATGHEVVFSFGSTGRLYAQITQGAPFDVFLAADEERPMRLENEGYAVAGSRFTYATGRLVLWSPDKNLVDDHGAVLGSTSFRRLAMANPELAPYGAAARSVLTAMELWEGIKPRIVMGQNIAQTYQFVQSGNAELGFVAYSQLMRNGDAVTGSLWLPPPGLYPAIRQQAVALRDTAAARAFLDYLKHEQALDIFRRFGYEMDHAD